MATIYEVSELAGVSLATVSRVMNNSGKVAAATRKRVEDAMRELGYRPNSIAQSLASHRSNCVGVLVSELHGPIFGALLGTIESELRHAGKFAIFSVGHNEAERERQGIEFLASRNCDALILHVEALPTEYFLENTPELLPFVLINRDDPPLLDNCIRLNNEQGGYLATRSLLELGHRRIGYISGPVGWGDADARIAGHRRALREFGVAFEDRLFVEGNYQWRSGELGTRRLLEIEPNLTAVVCANDEMAAASIRVIRDAGLGVPEDLSVIGFDNVRWSSYLEPQLTTIDYPADQLGCMAARWVLRNVYGDTGVEVQQDFEPRLVRRASSGPPRGTAASKTPLSLGGAAAPA
ncbi:MAG: LacI family DNA-binding transcriptional regulator [Xanthomonadales bacterium]